MRRSKMLIPKMRLVSYIPERNPIFIPELRLAVEPLLGGPGKLQLAPWL